jgi:hypothetical protein
VSVQLDGRPTSSRHDAPTAAAWPALAAVASAGLAVVAAVVAAVSSHSTVLLALGAAGYLLGAIVVTLLVSVHRVKDNRAHQHPEFRPRPVWGRVIAVSLVVGLAAAGWSAYSLATEISKW